MDITVKDLFDLDHTLAAEYLSAFKYPWEALSGIAGMIKEIGKSLGAELYEKTDEDVWVAKDAKIYPNVYIKGPAIIGKGSEVRPGAFIRGAALVGENCVVGNSTELKNVILFDNVEVPHYNYVGDSILGFHAHMGAGSITSNIKSDRKNIVVRNDFELLETGIRKIGAFLGDCAEIGCNSVLNPGTVIGRRTSVYPTSSVRGCVPPDHIYKSELEIIRRA